MIIEIGHYALVLALATALILSIVPVIGELVGDLPDDARPEATIYAQIDCGRRPLAYVCLHDVWEAIKLRRWQ